MCSDWVGGKAISSREDAGMYIPVAYRNRKRLYRNNAYTYQIATLRKTCLRYFDSFDDNKKVSLCIQQKLYVALGR